VAVTGGNINFYAKAVLSFPSTSPQNWIASVATSNNLPQVGWSGTAAQLGAGLVLPLGVYVRLGVDAAAGATWRHGETVGGGRVDAIARFLLDPFRESRLGFSVGGGVSAPIGSAEPSQPPYLTAVLDLEWPRHHGLTPALQVGLGGGTRIGFVLRRSPLQWR